MAVLPLLVLLATSQRDHRQLTTDMLYEVPARFSQGCPIVSLDLTSEREGRQSLDFMLDSGATRSMLLNRGEGRDREFEQGHRGVLVPGSGAVYLGAENFAAPNLGQFNPDLIGRLLDLKVRGLLGADFFASHDVLIDYLDQRVFIGRAAAAADDRADWTLVPAKPGSPTLKLRAVDSDLLTLNRTGNRAYATASVAGLQPTWTMRLDTWATRSTLRPESAAKLSRTGRTEHVTAADANFVADQVEAALTLGPALNLTLHPAVTDQVESILGSDAFQAQTLLIQLRNSLARVWPGGVPR